MLRDDLKRFWSRLRRWHPLWAVLGYLVLTLLLLAPVLSQFDRAIPGGPVARNDGWQNVWNLWWTRHALAEGANPFLTKMLYYPTGTPLYLQTLNITNGVLAAWLTCLAGPIAAYNFCVLLAFVLGGWSTYLLVRYLTHHEGAAFAAGVLFSFSPFHLDKLGNGQLELISLQWIPFFLLFLLRAVEERRPADIPLAALSLALVAMTSWYYGAFCAIYGGLFVIVWLAANRRRFGEILVRAGAALGGGALLLLPILIPGMISTPSSRDPKILARGLDLVILHSADAVDFFLPNPLHPVWGHWAYQVGSWLHPNIASWNAALGYVGLILAVVGMAMAWRQAWRWGVLLLCMLVLALGPTVHMAGRDTGIPTPYALVLRVPLLGLGRRPSHFVVLASLLLAILAAFGIRELLQRLRRRWQPLLLASILAVISFEYLPRPLPTLRLQVHPFYATLADRGGALLDLPARNESSGPLQAQIVHGRPIAGGYVARLPLDPFVERAPGIRSLWRIQPETPDIYEVGLSTSLVTLRAFDFRYVVVHWDLLDQGERQKMADVLRQVLGDVSPLFHDGEVSFYEVPQVPLVPLVYIGEGWYPLEGGGNRRWRWASGSAEVYVVNPFPQTTEVSLQLSWRSFQHPRRVDIYVDEQWQQQIEVPLALTLSQVKLSLSQGEHRVTLRAETDLEPTRSQRQLSFTCVSLSVR